MDFKNFKQARWMSYKKAGRPSLIFKLKALPGKDLSLADSTSYIHVCPSLI
jgi:hypothetical protein